MKFVVDRQPLLDALTRAARLSARAGTIPILANVLIRASKRGVVLLAGDTDRQSSDRIDADVAKVGEITVSARALHAFVRAAPDGSQVEIEVDPKTNDERLNARAARARARLMTLPADDFPKFGDEFAATFDVAGSDLVAMLDACVHAQSTEETRYYLNGIYLHVRPGADGAQELCAVATNGHTLGWRAMPMPEGADGMPGVIVPRLIAGEVRAMSDGAETVEVSVSEVLIRFRVGDLTVVSKLIDGTFPDYQRVIPADPPAVFEAPSAALQTTIDRIMFAVADDKERRLKVAVGKGELTVTGSSETLGEVVDSLEAATPGAPTEFGVNARYLKGALAALGEGDVKVAYSDPGSPMVLTNPTDAATGQVVMPMRL